MNLAINSKRKTPFWTLGLVQTLVSCFKVRLGASVFAFLMSRVRRALSINYVFRIFSSQWRVKFPREKREDAYWIRHDMCLITCISEQTDYGDRSDSPSQAHCNFTRCCLISWISTQRAVSNFDKTEESKQNALATRDSKGTQSVDST